MRNESPEDQRIRAILERVRTIALVGASPDSTRPANEVHEFLVRHGYDVTPVSPPHAGKQIHGREVVKSLSALPTAVDMVDVFRRLDAVGDVVEEAIAIGASVVWLQLGLVDEAAAAKARAAGLDVVMNRCPVIEWARLGMERPSA